MAARTMSKTLSYLGTCDASAAVRLGPSSLFVAASDEDYILRVYDSGAPGPPSSALDLIDFLRPADHERPNDDEKPPEPDIEGAALLGERIYWVTSHGQTKDKTDETGLKGMFQESRHRLFATSVESTTRGPRLRPVDRPYTRLREELLRVPELAALGLAQAATLAPEAPGGFNIEGMAPTPGGDLLLGFRNPIPEGRALMVLLRNAAELVDGRSDSPKLSIAGRLDLGGRGIRAIEAVPELRTYLVIGGAFDDKGDFRLYKWSGAAADAPVELPVDLVDCRPEELIVNSVRGRALDIELFSDDGDRLVGDKKCKKAKPGKQSFRSIQTVIEV
jgi:hypothetical protein